MPHHRECVIPPEQRLDDTALEILRFGHTPAVNTRCEGRHDRWVKGSRMTWADEDRPGSRHVLNAHHAKESDQVSAGHRAHEPAQGDVDHLAGRRTRMCRRMLSTTSSTVRSSVSMTTASGAGRRGATARSVSTLSRASPSPPIAPPSTTPPRPSHRPPPPPTFPP